jgi:hypothetical protein
VGNKRFIEKKKMGCYTVLMSEQPENLILEHLRHIRSELKTLKDGQTDIKAEILSIRKYLPQHTRGCAAQGTDHWRNTTRFRPDKEQA